MEEEQSESGYLFKDGKIIDFERIILDKIDYSRETEALRIRTTPNEIDVDFLAEAKPTKEQLETVKRLKTPNRKLFFEIVNKRDQHLKGYGGFDKTISEMEKQLLEFYNKNTHLTSNSHIQSLSKNNFSQPTSTAK